MSGLAGRTILMSGGSRGIGLAILKAAARAGANAVLLAKTDAPDPRLPGTIHSAVEAVQEAGGNAVAVVGDVRADRDVDRAVQTAIDAFGGVDIVINNASALNITPTLDLSPERYDLMQQVNSKGTFQLSRAALPSLFKAEDPQILTISPPINLSPHWLGKFPAYTLSKYGMTLLTLGFAAEFAGQGLRANCLWPQTTIATAVVTNLLGGAEAASRARDPEIMAESAVALLNDPSRPTGQVFLDVEVFARAGRSDFSRFGGGAEPELDFFVDER